MHTKLWTATVCRKKNILFREGEGGDIKPPVYSGIHHQHLTTFKLATYIFWRATLKMLRSKSKTQFVKQRRNMQNAIALFNYLKRIAQQQLLLRTQVFTTKILSAKNAATIVLLRYYLVGRISISARFELGSSNYQDWT
jgi:hypothetical protein